MCLAREDARDTKPPQSNGSVRPSNQGNRAMPNAVTNRATKLALAVVIVLCASGSAIAASAEKNAPAKTLTAFRSDAELLRYLKRVHRRPPPPPAPPAPQPAEASPPLPAPSDTASADVEAIAVTGSRLADEKITNTQEADVDEGGIVKMHGSTLVILRRGRLFTVATGDGDLRPVDSIDAFPPDVNARGDWYDEMLVAGDRVIVIGYSYARGGTEINRFKIDRAGNLSFEDAYHLRSNDYYSSRNYASRLIGTKLVVYAPLYLRYDDVLSGLPGLRRWAGSEKAKFKRLVSARRIYTRRHGGDLEEDEVDTLHTITSCDLAAPTLDCDATSVLGPGGRTFYVSSHAVYVWVSSWWRHDQDNRGPKAVLYRLPLNGSAPSAIGVRGAPTDQFSFREDWSDGRINVLVRSEGAGDAMWAPEFAQGAVALLRLPLSNFGNGNEEARRRHYRALPKPADDGYGFQNRFIGGNVLYGTGNTWWEPQAKGTTLVVAAVANGRVTEIPLDHGVERIEAMGRDAVVVGADKQDLHFQAVEMTAGPRPVLGDRYTLEGASQGETRSHAFFFKPEPKETDNTAGVMALPVARAARPGHRQLVENSASILFLRRTARRFRPLGELEASESGVVDDACVASCVDWYGNARPIFLSRRTFALMGYELVEGELRDHSIREKRRVSFAPRTK